MAVASSLLVILAIIVLVAVIAAVVAVATRKPEIPTEAGKGSYFDGSVLGLFGWRFLGNFLTSITFGIAYPWAMCMITRWEVKHTVINGRRLKFNGNGAQLFGKYILWWFLTIITFGIYSIWMGLGLEKWKVKHIVYADKKGPDDSRFAGNAGGWFINHLLVGLLIIITFGIAYPWADVRLRKWKASNTVIGGSPLVFSGKGGTLWLKLFLCAILTPLTLGIYPIFVFPVTLLKWHYKNVDALYRTAPIIALSRSHEESANKDYAKIRLAANDSELAAVKSGYTGNESGEELEALASGGNIFACYTLAKKLKGDAPKFEGRALELLKTASDAGHHQALFDYSDYTESPDGKINLLEESAKHGNAEAAWALTQLYLGKKKNDLDTLTKSAYWFKVSIELEIPEAVAAKKDYDELLESIAILHAGKHKCDSGSAVGIIAAAAVGGVVLLLVAALTGLLLFPRLSFDGRKDAVGTEPMTEGTRISIAQGSSNYCTVKPKDIVRYGSSSYKAYDFETGNNKMTAKFSDNTVVLDFHLGRDAYYDDVENILYLDFGVNGSSNINGTDKMSIYLVSEDVKDANGKCKVLSGILHPGEKIAKIPCEFPSGVSKTQMHIIVINSRDPKNTDLSKLWVADVYQKKVNIHYEPIGNENTDETSKNEESKNDENNVETPENNTQYAYSIGNVKTNPTDSDFQAFYSMLKDNPEIWMRSSSFVSANLDAKTIVENYLFDDGLSWGLFSRFAFDSDFVTRPEYANAEHGMEFKHARYRASDVDWVIKAVFNIEPLHWYSTENSMFYEGEYFYRLAIEYHMGAGMTDVITFNPTYEEIDDGVYKFNINLSTKWEYDDGAPEEHNWEFLASPMHSQDLGTYWRIISFTKR